MIGSGLSSSDPIPPAIRPCGSKQFAPPLLSRSKPHLCESPLNREVDCWLFVATVDMGTCSRVDSTHHLRSRKEESIEESALSRRLFNTIQTKIWCSLGVSLQRTAAGRQQEDAVHCRGNCCRN